MDFVSDLDKKMVLYSEVQQCICVNKALMIN